MREGLGRASQITITDYRLKSSSLRYGDQLLLHNLLSLVRHHQAQRVSQVCQRVRLLDKPGKPLPGEATWQSLEVASLRSQ